MSFAADNYTFFCNCTHLYLQQNNQLLGYHYYWFLEKVVLTKNCVKQVKWNQLIKKIKRIHFSEGISVS